VRTSALACTCTGTHIHESGTLYAHSLSSLLSVLLILLQVRLPSRQDLMRCVCVCVCVCVFVCVCVYALAFFSVYL
jgi:hypothetical protein